MNCAIYVAAALAIALLIGSIVLDGRTQSSPDTFPDKKFTTIFKKYSTKEIAAALDEM